MTTRCKMLFGGFFRQKENFVCLKNGGIGRCPRPLSVCFLFRTSAGRLRVTPFPFPCIETKWQFLKRIRGDRKNSTDMYSINFRNKGWKRTIWSWSFFYCILVLQAKATNTFPACCRWGKRLWLLSTKPISTIALNQDNFRSRWL